MPPVTNVQGAAAGRRRMEVVTVMRRSMMRIIGMMVTMIMVVMIRRMEVVTVMRRWDDGDNDHDHGDEDG